MRRDGTPVPLQAIPGYAARHRVTPGLTGIAQIYAPRDIPRRQKFKLDQLYVGKQSFWLDLRLIVLSLMISLDSALRFTEEASWCTRVAGRTCLFDLQQQRVAVAIDERFDQPLRVSRGLAFAPQFLSRARPIGHLTRR